MYFYSTLPVSKRFWELSGSLRGKRNEQPLTIDRWPEFEIRCLEEVGLECAVWPHLYPRTNMCETHVRASDSRRLARKGRGRRQDDEDSSTDDSSTSSSTDSGSLRAFSQCSFMEQGTKLVMCLAILCKGDDYFTCHYCTMQCVCERVELAVIWQLGAAIRTHLSIFKSTYSSLYGRPYTGPLWIQTLREADPIMWTLPNIAPAICRIQPNRCLGNFSTSQTSVCFNDYDEHDW